MDHISLTSRAPGLVTYLDLPVDRVNGHGLVVDDDLVGRGLWYRSLADLERDGLLAGDPSCLV